MSNKTIVNFANRKAVKVHKWKVELGQTVYHGRALLLYEDGENGKLSKLKSKCVGTVVSLIAKEGEILNPGDPVLEVEEGCSHPTVINDLCAECGADLQKEGVSESNATVPMVHHIPQLKVSQQEAQLIGKADTERLLKDRKLVLLVDLDQTLIHTTHDNIPSNIKDVHHFQLGSSAWYHTRLRPNTAHFLKEMSVYFELHICTFGVRPYAHMVASILDKDQSLFSNRILSRDECFDFNSKVANLQALFPNGDELVCIIDDRKDVWNNSPNLIPVKPYTFFTNTGDINDPNLPPIAKHSEFFAKGVKVKKREEEGAAKEGDGDMLDVEDEDDYLLYLETILKKVHSLFYQVYDKKITGQSEVRWILEQLRGKVLSRCEIVFSGLVPLHEGLERSEPYMMATDLGAKIGKSVCESTTHIVAAREGTAKLHESKKFPNIKIVNPQWLTTCLYRWEQVDERLFPLIKGKDDDSRGKVPISLSLEDVMSMQQEVQAEFNSDSDSGKVSDHKSKQSTLSQNGNSNQSAPLKVAATLTVEKSVFDDIDVEPYDPCGVFNNYLSLSKSADHSIKIGDHSTKIDDHSSKTGGHFSKICEQSSKIGDPSFKIGDNSSRDGLPSTTVVDIPKPRREPSKPTFLDFLHSASGSEALQKFQIPKKKVRILDTPEICLISDEPEQVSPRKFKKQKIRDKAKTLPTSSNIKPNSATDAIPYFKRKEQVLTLKLKHLETAQRLIEDEHTSKSRNRFQDHNMKMERLNSEYAVRINALYEESHQSLKNLNERHNLALSNLVMEHECRMSNCQGEHQTRIKLMNIEHETRLKNIQEEHLATLKTITKDLHQSKNE